MQIFFEPLFYGLKYGALIALGCFLLGSIVHILKTCLKSI